MNLIVLASFATLTAYEPAPPLLAPAFGDHMVLQRQTHANMWGWSVPGDEIEVIGSWGSRAKAIAAKDGSWKTAIKTGNAGGPFEFSIKSKKSPSQNRTINDVLFGDVWLCSGQSNMEMTVRKSYLPPLLNQEQEIASANYPQIRSLNVTKNMAEIPTWDLKGRWDICSPETVGNFTATGYFFARKLHQELKIPIGIVHSSWGGTEVELWTSVESLSRNPDLKASHDRRKTAWNRALQAQRAWRTKFEAAAGTFSDPKFNDSDWDKLDKPGNWSLIGRGQFDGAIWYRATVQVPESLAAKPAVLQLGQIDDEDMTYINGQLLGGSRTWNDERVYKVNAGTLKAGENIVAIRVIDTAGIGGFIGETEKNLSIQGTSLPLTNWRYKESANMAEHPVTAATAGRPGAQLFNGMIHPLVPMSLKGFTWYQGEANVGRAFQYRTSFPNMITDWRNHFGQGNLPFYFVQIAPFSGYGAGTAASELREAQAMTLKAVPNTGMAVTTDITGDLRDIHPINKQDVGLRLALWALNKTYGKGSVMPSGPLYRSHRVENGVIKIAFEFADGLAFSQQKSTGFLIAGADTKFHPATAEVHGKEVWVSSPAVLQPVAARYSWSETAEGFLTNKAKLPASPFRTDSWTAETQAAKW